MKLDGALRKEFRLGDWVVRPIEGVVIGANESRHLQPKTMDVLAALAASSGQVVTRDELLTRVWGANAVSDEPLTRCIHELRRALNDDRGEPTFIQTIPKRGYRLLQEPLELGTVEELLLEHAGPRENPLVQVSRQHVLWVGVVYALLAYIFVQFVRLAEASAHAQLAPPEWLMPAMVVLLLLGFPVAIFYAWARQLRFDSLSAALMGGSTMSAMRGLLWSRRGIDVVLVTLVISLLAGLALDVMPFEGSGAAMRARPGIAVLPFTSNTKDADIDWLGQGMAEDLHAQLINHEQVAVSSISASFRDSLQRMRPQQVGHELQVQYVLTGFIIRSSDTLRIRAYLVDSITGLEVWAASWTRAPDELFVVQRELSNGVLNYFGIEAPDAAAVASVSVNVYDSYLRGRGRLREARTYATAAEAAGWFERSLAADPNAPMVRDALCAAYVLAMQLGDSDAIYGRANSACAEAILRSPASPASHLVLADFYRVSGHAEEALREYEWVINAEADNPAAWFGLAHAYAGLGSPADAEDAFRRVIALKPDCADAHEAFAAFLLEEGRYADALEVSRYLVRLDSERLSGYEYLATALFMRGEFPDSIRASREVLSRDIDHRSAVMQIALSHYHMGHYQNSINIYTQVARLFPESHAVHGGLGSAYSQLADAESQLNARESFGRARALAERHLLGNAADIDTTVNLAYYCAALADQECAQEHLGAALEWAPDNMRTHYMAALVHARAGDSRAAGVATQRALALGYPEALFATNPVLAVTWSERPIAYSRFSSIFQAKPTK